MRSHLGSTSCVSAGACPASHASNALFLCCGHGQKLHKSGCLNSVFPTESAIHIIITECFFLMATCRVHLIFQWARCPISGYAHGNVCLFCLALQPGAPVVRSGLVLPSSHFSPFSAFFCPPLLGTTADLLLWSARARRCVYC